VVGNGRCIPFKYTNCGGNGDREDVKVLMINSPARPGLLFPKVSCKIHAVRDR
jgi:hypothetical protein